MSAEPVPALDQRQLRRRARHKILWRIINPPTRPLAGLAPWWVLLETRGWRTGLPRRTPLARGPVDEDAIWLASVHGRHASWVRNLDVHPEVRIKLSSRWHVAHATVEEFDENIARQFNVYARTGPRTLGIDPVLVRIDRHS
jgi:deazaflavin-dependent oxidoreductase (nitroreductase family)